MIKLIVTDIDGTLVKDGETMINSEYFKVIHQLKEQGIHFVAASGRQYTSIRKVFEPLADEGGFCAITEGGAMIFEDEKPINQVMIPETLMKELIEDVKKLKVRGCDVMLSTVNGALCPHQDSELYRWMYNSYKYDIKAVGGYNNLPAADIVKLSIYHPFDCEKIVKEWFYDKWSVDSERGGSYNLLKISSAGVWWMDCVLPEATKGQAILKLQRRFQVREDETMAFGDNLNDIEMLQHAGESYAVANGREETKAAAKHIAPGYAEDGVLTVLKTLLSS